MDETELLLASVVATAVACDVIRRVKRRSRFPDRLTRIPLPMREVKVPSLLGDDDVHLVATDGVGMFVGDDTFSFEGKGHRDGDEIDVQTKAGVSLRRLEGFGEPLRITLQDEDEEHVYVYEAATWFRCIYMDRPARWFYVRQKLGHYGVVLGTVMLFGELFVVMVGAAFGLIFLWFIWCIFYEMFFG